MADDRSQVDEWMPLIYDELRQRAEALFRRQPAGQTLQPTALVHEVYLRLSSKGDDRWSSRTHFLAYAGKAMQNLLIDLARKRKQQGLRLALDGFEPTSEGPEEVESAGLLQALERLSEMNERHALVVVLRFFAGLKVDEVADHLGVSKNTVEKDWNFARLWLLNELDQRNRINE